MHSPKPYGLLVKGDMPTERDMAFIESVARRLTNFKLTGQLDSLKWEYELPDGGWFIVQDMGGTFRVITTKGHVDELVPTGFAQMYIPTMFSGVITRNMVKEDEGVGIRLTEQCRRRLASYQTENLPPKDVSLKRFVIEYAEKFNYFKPKMTGIYTFTQYVKQRPTWYSGAMAEVMQIVGGYGIVDFNNLPDDPIERAQVKLPEKYYKMIEAELADLRLPAYGGLPDPTGQFTYDYKHSLTNAIGFDTANKPWLLRIDGSGVHAMPLPMFPATTTKGFREYIESVNDSEILAILDRFGGMPSGENFPSDIEAWVRAGAIVKVCDASDFYTNSAMYSACGWSVNSRGSEGFNTCWSYQGDMKYVHGYKMKLNLVAETSASNQPPVTVPPEQSAAVGAYLSKLMPLIGDSDTGRAIKYKLRRVGLGMLVTRVNNTVDSKEVDYWDNLVVAPIAPHTGNIARTMSGPIYIGITDNPLWEGRMKFPTLDGVGCESFNMTSADYKGGVIRCDTVMFGCYVEDQLRVIKYFFDDRKFTKEEYSTFEDIMQVGSWEKETVEGLTGLMGHFYTTDFDDRQEQDPTTTYTTIQGTDLGYGNPAYHTPPLLLVRGTLNRARYFKHVTKTTTKTGFGIDVAACVPVYGRDCILYPYSEYSAMESEYEEHSMGGVGDPTSYEIWTYDPIFHYMFGGGKGEPKPTIGDYAYVDKMNYDPSPENEFADSGNWFNFPEGGYINVSSICVPYTHRNAAHHGAGVTVGGEAPSIVPYSHSSVSRNKESGTVKVSVENASATTVHKRMPDAWYYTFSPVEAGGSLSYFYRDMCRVTFGDSTYTSLSEKGEYNKRKRWGSTKLVPDDDIAYHFIGVINE